ncbi:uncharacterized protein LOC111621687 [Centruroides sculpturatus]|uniref:uncharacterized protein LOC111621687 n=1 Tax=Centruroides sculpturatus TaxID=218467 RepID=UPI000C6CF9EB|nr:uncharacterized protein LOC111621687 [Centruroides sculpturatus]
MAHNLESVICLNCALKPYLSTATVYGWSFFLPCTFQIKKTILAYRIIDEFLLIFIELIYWEHFILTFLLTIPYVSEKIPCISWYSVVNNNIFVKVSVAMFAFVLALCFSIFKRTKLNPTLKIRMPKFFLDKKLYEKFDRAEKIVLFIIIFLTIAMQLANILLFYPALEKGKQFSNEAFYCCIEVGIWICVIIGGIVHLVYVIILLVITFMKSFQKLSENLYLLKENDRNLYSELEKIMAQHAELWDFISTEFNNRFVYPLTVLYSCLITETSLVYYITASVDTNILLRTILCIISCLVTYVCVLIGFFYSIFTSAMQTSFQDIRRFADCNLTLEQKLNVLNFMKKFGKASLCLSVNGYFNITKKFPVKMASALNSVYSGIERLSEVSKEKISCHY